MNTSNQSDNGKELVQLMNDKTPKFRQSNDDISNIVDYLECHKMPLVNYDIIETLLLNKFTSEKIAYVCMSSKNIFKHDKNILNELIINLRNIGGFDNDHISDIICSKDFDAFSLNEHNIFTTTQCLRSLNLQDDIIQHCVTKNTQLFATDYETLCSTHFEMTKYFTRKDVFRLIHENSRILTDDWSNSFEKLRYVCVEMGLNQRDAVFSQLFRYDLQYIKTRHLFLERAGLYVKPNPRLSVQKLSITLNQILGTDLEDFVSMFTPMSVADYITFEEILKQDDLHCEHSESEEYSDDDETDVD